MKIAIIKSMGNILKDGFNGIDEETATAIVWAAAVAAPYISEAIQDLLERAEGFADRVMENNYRFQAGSVVLEPAGASE